MDDMSEQSGPQAGNPSGTQTDPSGQQSGPRVSREQMRDVDRLRRSSSDRYIAGVAGGLGRHFDVDPTIIRVVLAVLTFFGGAGVLVYGAVWLFVPEDGHATAPVEVGTDARRIILLVAGVIALSVVFGSPFFGGSWGHGFPLSLLVIGLICVALFATRDQRRQSRNQPPPPWGSVPTAAQQPAQQPYQPPAPEGTTMTVTDTRTETGQQPPAWMPPPPPAYVPPPPRPRRTGLVLFWPTLALIAIALGTLGIFDVNGSVQPSAYVALAVAIIAGMLLIGAFVGRPGGLIALGILATLGLGITSAVEASTDWETGGENLRLAPVSALAVQDSYTVPNGQITLDLTGVRDIAALDGREIDLHLNAGEIDVTLPPGVNAVVNAEMRFAGDITIDGSQRGGFDQSLTRTITGSTDPNAPTLTLDLHARVGEISVVQD
jgi:phage shock protein PspC (stress-responsive transcriptional regulator)